VKNSLLVALALGLTACATTSGPKPGSPAVSGTFLAPASPNSSQPFANPRGLIVDSATAMLGQPYRWGGAAPGGFDCSGLVVYATNSAGLHLPRTAEEQLHAGVSVSRRELRAGDLVFLHLKRKELHVGIAIDSDRFVHAPATGGYVRIDSLAAAPYARGFLKARRIVDVPTAPP
jgi:cell wall-associated NlpC family hydrolase